MDLSKHLKISANTLIQVQVNTKGASVYNEYYETVLPGILEKYRPKSLKENDFVELSFWEISTIFKKELYHGGDNCFTLYIPLEVND